MFDVFKAMLDGVPWTIAVTLLSFTIGCLLGFPICWLRMSPFRIISFATASLVLIIRSIPPIVWLFFVFFGAGGGVLNLSPFAAAITGLGIITAAQMSEVYRGALSAVSVGQYEAAHVLNLNARQRFVDIILPQMLRIVVPSAATYAISLLKDSAVASTIGVTDISAVAYQVTQQTFKGIEVYTTAALLYLFLSVPVALFSRWLGATLNTRISR